MIIIYSIVAIFIAWIWVDYFRLIDIYKSESLKYFILTFFLGCASVLIVIGINRYILDKFFFELNGNFINDILYTIFKIGLVEESAKIIPFVIMYSLFKKQFNDPIDYLAFICIAALGFSAAENVEYFQRFGPDIITSRAILSSVGHMFDSSLFAYGIIRYKFYPNNKGKKELIIFFFLAVFSHGFYDFCLMYPRAEYQSWLIVIPYFYFTITLFATILNNAINHSTSFSYKKVIDSDMVASRLLMYYGIVFAMQYILVIDIENFNWAVTVFSRSLFSSGFVIVVCCIRLSRFKLIKDKWEKLKIEFPFAFHESFDPSGTLPFRYRLRISGESYSEAYLNIFYEEYFFLNPLSKRITYLVNPRLAFIERKFYLTNDDVVYLAKVFHDNENGQFEKMLLKPKINDTTMVSDKYQIVAVLKIDKLIDIDGLTDIENVTLTADDSKFKEWAFVKPKETTLQDKPQLTEVNKG